MSRTVELRLLTDKAKLTRFDFVWVVEGTMLPIMAVIEGERELRHALREALGPNGVLSGFASKGHRL